METFREEYLRESSSFAVTAFQHTNFSGVSVTHPSTASPLCAYSSHLSAPLHRLALWLFQFSVVCFYAERGGAFMLRPQRARTPSLRGRWMLVQYVLFASRVPNWELLRSKECAFPRLIFLLDIAHS